MINKIQTDTSFARHYELRERVKTTLKAELKGRTVKVLDVGLGRDTPRLITILNYLGVELKSDFPQYTYEPIEIADYLERMGLEYHIDAVDINPAIISSFCNQNEIFIALTTEYPSEGFYNSFLHKGKRRRILEDEIEQYNHVNHTKFPDYKLAHIVEIPSSIRNKISAWQANIEGIELNGYDLVVYNVVSIYLNEPEKTLERIVHGMNEGGFLFTTEIVMPERYCLREVDRVKLRSSSGVCYQKVSSHS